MKTLVAAFAAAIALLALGGGATAVISPAVDMWWLSGSIQNDRFAMATGGYAELHARTPEARALAAQIVGDNRQNLNADVHLGILLHFAVPRTPSGLQLWLAGIVKGQKRGTAYDQAYTSMEVQSVSQAIVDTQLEIDKGASPKVVAMAKRRMAMLKVHLMLAQRAWTAST